MILVVVAIVVLVNMGVTWLVQFGLAGIGYPLPFWPLFALVLVVGLLFGGVSRRRE